MSLELLTTAIRNGNKQELEYLLSVETSSHKDFSLDITSNGISPLCVASELSNPDIVVLLLSYGASANFKLDSGKTALHFACDKEERSNNHTRIVEELISSGAIVNEQDNEDQAPIHFACTAENMEIVECLLANNADINITDADEETPLVRACYAEHFELIKLLVNNGCRIDYPNNTPLCMCVSRGIIPAVKLLLEKGLDIHSNEYMSCACEFNQLNMMDYLHSLDVDVNRRRTSTVFGFTPLHVACLTQSVQCVVVEKLLLWGADVTLTSATGDTALHYAAQQLDCAKVKLLLQYGAPVGIADDIGLTPLTAALTSILNPSQMCTIIELFSVAGFHTSQMLEDVVKKHHPNNTEQLNKSVLTLLHDLSTNTLTLKDLCRIQIRNILGQRIPGCLIKLQLPKLLISYLNLSDVNVPSLSN